jgi:hypothetical protein
MSWILILIGIAFLISSVLNTQGDFLTLLRGDFIGMQSFVFWMLAILAIGALGYIPGLRKLANGFLVLVILMLFISNKGFFNQFISQVSSVKNAPQQTITDAPTYNMQDQDTGANVNVNVAGGSSTYNSSPQTGSQTTNGGAQSTGVGSQVFSVDSQIKDSSGNVITYNPLLNLPTPNQGSLIDNPGSILGNVYASYGGQQTVNYTGDSMPPTTPPGLPGLDLVGIGIDLPFNSGFGDLATFDMNFGE